MRKGGSLGGASFFNAVFQAVRANDLIPDEQIELLGRYAQELYKDAASQITSGASGLPELPTLREQ